jgi:hypothetical protein
VRRLLTSRIRAAELAGEATAFARFAGEGGP